jgi:hypothetical protein
MPATAVHLLIGLLTGRKTRNHADGQKDEA